MDLGPFYIYTQLYRVDLLVLSVCVCARAQARASACVWRQCGTSEEIWTTVVENIFTKMCVYELIQITREDVEIEREREREIDTCR